MKSPRRLLAVSLPCLVLACGDDTSRTELGDDGLSETGIPTTSGDGDGDESGTSVGDGDGDSTTTGDGDGDPTTTGDGDGDPTTTGDGDGDPTTTTTGDGDGDPTTTTGDGDGDPPLFCNPGTVACADDNNTQTCVDDGSSYGDPVPCDPDTVCSAGACLAECELIQANPSSIGCSFFAARMDNHNAGDLDSLIAGNISPDKAVTAQLYFVPVNGGAEQPEGGAVQIPPKGTYTWTLNQVPFESTTGVRQGGVYRLETSRPVVAYQHSPIGAVFTNDASMLLPEHALTGNYVVSSYPGTVGPYPSYFTAISIADGNLVDITVGGATAAGGGIPALAAGGSTQVALNRYGLMNVVVQAQQGGDLSGTIVSASGPLHLVGATECANVPNSSTLYCDHVEEAMLPLEYWGDEYVGAHAPVRSGNEDYFWRVYGGEDGVTINTSPPQPGFPVQLDKGEYYSFTAAQAPNDSFVFTGTGPFLPVQYLEGQTGGGNTGDPSMIQSVPTEQYLDAYAFVTGTGYSVQYVQIIRPAGGADVYIDDVLVAANSFYTVGAYEVADVSISQGAHFANSIQPFGIIQVGYTNATSYGYPGGMRLAVINPQ